jgi:hypothetical protein
VKGKGLSRGLSGCLVEAHGAGELLSL